MQANIKARAKSPLRLGFAGGGTDLSPYCDEFGGCVINMTIDRYAYAFLAPRNDNKIVFVSAELNITETIEINDWENADVGDLKLHFGVYKRIIEQFFNGIPKPVTITTMVDAPIGSGLGSSSALMVALVDVFRAFYDLPLGLYDVTHLAFEIERKDLQLAGGKQDHYAAAFGGVNFIEFMANDRVIVNPLRIKEDYLNELEASLIACFSGQSRCSDQIILQQTKEMASHSTRTIQAMHALKEDTIHMKSAILSGNIQEIAKLLNHSWSVKKLTAKTISNDLIDNLYKVGMENGALAGKLSGAGGGGFFMFVAPPENRQQLINALEATGSKASSIKLFHKGSQTWLQRQH